MPAVPAEEFGMAAAPPEKTDRVTRQQTDPRMPDLQQALRLLQERMAAIASVLAEPITEGNQAHTVAEEAAGIVDILLEHPVARPAVGFA